jgi:hypothetical protein
MIVDAQQVAMHQQHASSVKIDHRAVRQELDAGFAAEGPADEEVAIAVDEVRLHAGARDRTQTLEHAPLVRVGIVIADPRFEQGRPGCTALRRARLALQEVEELRGDVGPACRRDAGPR